MSADLALMNADAGTRLGDLLLHLGAEKVSGSPDCGRASCPVHRGHDLNLSYSNAKACCFVCGKGWDAVGLVRDALAVPFPDAVAALREFLRGSMPPRRVAKMRPIDAAPVRDAQALWSRLSLTDTDGEEYLRSRALLPDVIPDDVLRFNVGRTGDVWLDARASEGYRVAFALRDATGVLKSIVLRFCDPTRQPGRLRKAPVLPGLTTRGAAICRPEIAFLASGDPEFERDELIVTEGPTDFLAATLTSSFASLDRGATPAWALGVIGAPNVANVLTAFGNVIRNRRVRLWLDSDEAGERAIPEAVEAAYAAGAAKVTRYRPLTKDVADSWKAVA